LEDRRLLAVQPVSLAHAGLYGASGNGESEQPFFSAEGRFLAFTSRAGNLVANDSNGAISDIFIRDLSTGETVLASATPGGGSGDGDSFNPRLNADGRFVVFESDANDLVPDDFNFETDIFVRDLATGTTTLVSMNLEGTGGGDERSFGASISADGRYVAFLSEASNLVVGDTNGQADVYVRDLATGVTQLVSATPQGAAGDGSSSNPLLSADGRLVVFESNAEGLVANDANGQSDVFVRDLGAGTTALISTNGVSSGNGASTAYGSSISTDGRFVVFESMSDDLVNNDSNHRSDVFVRDLDAEITTLVSVNRSGVASNGFTAIGPASADGRYVVFMSTANDLTEHPGDPSGRFDVYVRDLVTGETSLASVNAAGAQASSGPAIGGGANDMSPKISADGRYVSFVTAADGIVPNDADDQVDIYLRDLQLETTVLASKNPGTVGGGINLTVAETALSSDGSRVAFVSWAADLVEDDGDNNDVQDVFVFDAATARVNLVSARPESLPLYFTGNDDSLAPVVSADGRFVAFYSFASNLVPEDFRGMTSFGGDVFLYDTVAKSLELVSVNATGDGPGGDNSFSPSISADGRIIAFASLAENLTGAPDPNFGADVFARDIQSGTTSLVSINMSGEAAGGEDPVVSANGRFVVFRSRATNLVPGFVDANGSDSDLYVRDLITGTTTLVTADAGGAGGGNGRHGAPNDFFDGGPQISADGHYVAFSSSSTNLIAGFVDANGNQSTDIYVRDLVAGVTTLVSRAATAATGGNGASRSVVLSGTGRYVAFESDASDLVAGDTNGKTDVFVHDLETGATVLASVNATGNGPGNSDSFNGSRFGQSRTLSDDGNYLLFASQASDLAAGDNNFQTDVFLRDLTAGTTTLVSASGLAPGAANAASGDLYLALSADGRTAAFSSRATDLTPGFIDGEGVDLYVRDLDNQTTTLVTRNSPTGMTGTGGDDPVLSADGQVLAFTSDFRLDAGDANAFDDVYMYRPDPGASIRGQVFEDQNANGMRDPNEPPLANWHVFLDANSDGDFGPGETGALTGADGAYVIAGLAPGAYQVAQQVPAEFQQTLPEGGAGYQVVIATASDEAAGKDFGNERLRLVQLDLVATIDQVPASGASGQSISIQWTVANGGEMATDASWQDAIYLSADDRLDPSDTLLTTRIHTGGLAAGASYTVKPDVVFPAKVAGDYHLIVLADRRYNVAEDDEQNNLHASAPISIDHSILRVGETVDGEFLPEATVQYFSLYLLRGQTVRLRLDAVGGETELSVLAASLPGGGRFSSRAAEPGADQELIVTALEEGPHYVAVRALKLPGEQADFTLSAELASFSVDALDLNTADRGGPATIGLRGIGLTSNLTAELRDSEGNRTLAQRIAVVSDREAYATFDLTQLAPGVYDVIASQTVTELAVDPNLPVDDPNFFRLDSIPQVDVLSDAFTVTEAAPDALHIDIAAPAAVRPGREFDVVVTVTNQGAHDLAMPLLEVETSDPRLIIALAGVPSLSYGTGLTHILPMSATGPADILRPGAAVKFSVRIRASGADSIEIAVSPVIEDDAAVDWEGYVRSLGEDPTTSVGTDRLVRLQDRYGATVASWAAAMRDQVRNEGLTFSAVLAEDLLRQTAYQSTSDVVPAPIVSDLGASSGVGESEDPPTPDLSRLKERFEKILKNQPDEHFFYRFYNVCLGDPGQPINDLGLRCRETVLYGIAGFLFLQHATTGSFHLSRFLGELGPTPPPSALNYVDGDILTSGIRATGHQTDFGYGLLHETVQDALKELVKDKADDLPEDESPIAFSSEIVPKFREILGRKPGIKGDYLAKTGSLALWTYQNGRLSFGSALLDPQTAIGRVEGTGVFDGTAKKKADECERQEITYKGQIEYTFPDVYRFGGDGGSSPNLNFNIYAEELQLYGYASIFGATVTMREMVEGKVNPKPKQNPTKECKPEPDPDAGPGPKAKVDILRAVDPNEIIGPAGFGPQRFRPPSAAPLPYTIYYENDPDQATAPAQEVVITHQLDADLDWSTFELSSFGFGDLTIDAPPGLQEYQTRVEYHNQDGSPLLVDVFAGLNRDTGLATWTFRSVDPISGALPDGVFDGFLPVNDDTGRGEGFASYSIRPKTALTTGVTFDQQASIVFDINEPIVTNTFTNTIDAEGPTSQVAALPPRSSNPNIAVSWSGDDGGGSGIASYDVFISIDGGPFELWLDDTSEAGTIYPGELGHEYAFYSVARDHVGWTEAAPAAADTHIVVQVLSWTNADEALDVDDDDGVGLNDLLQIVQFLRNFGENSGFAVQLPSPDATFGPPPFVDVNRDGVASLSDLLQVVQALREQAAQPAGGEGESNAPQLTDAAFAAWLGEDDRDELLASLAW
jgi:Tol biopolymer transport system component